MALFPFIRQKSFKHENPSKLGRERSLFIILNAGRWIRRGPIQWLALNRIGADHWSQHIKPPKSDEPGGKGLDVSGFIGPLLVRAQFVSEATRYNEKLTHATGPTSPSDTFRALKDDDRGWSEIAEDRRMGGPGSDG